MAKTTPAMTPERFTEVQKALGWTNERTAQALGKTAQSVSNYRRGRQTIPSHVEKILTNEVQSRSGQSDAPRTA